MSERSGTEAPVDVDRHLLALRRGLPAIALVAIAFAALTVVLSSRMPARYEASASVAIQETQDGGGTAEDAIRTLGTANALIASPSVVNGTAARLRLAPAELASALTSRVDPTANIIQITGSAGSPALAARIANAGAETFLAVRREGIERSLVAPQNAIRGEISRLTTGGTGGVGELEARLADLQVRAAFAGEDLRLLSPAVPPSEAAAPRPILNGFIALVVVAIGMALAVVARDTLRRRVTSTGQLGEIAGTPIVALLDRPGPVRAVEDNDAPARLAVESWLEDSRMVVVSAGAAGVDAARVVARLGRAFAHAGRDVLVVDGDLADPSLHDRFEVPLDAGFNRVLERMSRGRGMTPTGLRRMAHTVGRVVGGQGRLSVLTTGEPSDDAGRSVTVEGIRATSRLLRESDHDLVFVLTAPIASSAEAAVLAADADRLLLIVSEATSVAEADELASVTAQAPIPVALVVLRHARRRRVGSPARQAPAAPLRWPDFSDRNLPPLRVAKPVEAKPKRALSNAQRKR
jgi:capsular polysaccharide biosynthesis protein